MCCKCESHHGGGHQGRHHGSSCGCGGHAGGRQFWTKTEKIDWLEEYLEDLQTEVKSIEERITALKEE